MAMSVQDWLEKFQAALADGSAQGVGDCFTDTALWRDYLAFEWTLQTIEGGADLASFGAQVGPGSGSSNWNYTGGPNETEGFISFETSEGRGNGYIRLQDGKCYSLLTCLDELKGHEEKIGARRVSGVVDDPDGRNWRQLRDAELNGFGPEKSPYVLIVGGGQAGLALGARLGMLRVPYLIVDRKPRVGDQWRSRYESLTLHDPVWYDHMPYMPFPEFWPVFTPKDKMGDWLEAYADALELNVWTSTECASAEYDEQAGVWRVQLKRGDETIEVTPAHLTMAVGNAGYARVPDIPGQDLFAGEQMHSSAFPGGDGLSGKTVVVVGANNSAHDIAADLVAHGAKPIMIQRSSTLIIRQSTLTEVLLKPVYSQEAVEAGLTTDMADLLSISAPLRLQEPMNKEAWDAIQVLEAPFYKRLSDVGFNLDFGPDGTGLAMKYQRTASGYYIDVGACEMIADGRIGLRSGVNIERLTPEGMQLDTGEALHADMIIYATGFGSMEEWVASLIDPDTASKVGKCWGYGSDTPGDPGPWEGEIRNMWKPTAQDGLWFMGGNLAQVRIYSKYLGLQFKARYEDMPTTL